MSRIAHILSVFLCCLWIASGMAQQRNDQLDEVMALAPGRDRVLRLIELAAQERSEGRVRFAIEFSILASAEAETHGLHQEYAAAQFELSKTYLAKGDVANAIGACVRISRAEASRKSGMYKRAQLELAELYHSSGHPQKAMEYLLELERLDLDGPSTIRYHRISLRVRSQIMEPPAALEFCARTEDAITATGDASLLLDLQSLQASSLARTGDHEAALKLEEQVLRSAIQLDLPVEAGISANNIGELHLRLGRNDEALRAFAKGLIMVEDLPQLHLGMSVNAAHAHARSGNVEVGIRMVDEAIRVARKAKDEKNMPRLLRTLAALRQLQGEVAQAHDLALKALALAEERSDLREVAACHGLLAGLCESNDRLAEARSHRKRQKEVAKRMAEAERQTALALEAELVRLQRIEREQADRMNHDEHREARMKQLALNAENHEKQLALLMYEKQLEAAAHREASLQRDQATKALHLAQVALEAERQDRLIQELENNRMLQSLTMARLEAEQKERQKDLELLEERNRSMEAKSMRLAAEQERDRDLKKFYITLITGFSILSILLFQAWRSARKKKRTIQLQNQEIQGINQVLAQRDQDIQSSLGYARTIQSAILPSESVLRSLIPESFLLYRPLDQVSGDLPFLKQVGRSIYLAAIDCTGHGVPAAMMTFIAYYGLNELIGDDPNASCGALLDRLHEHVHATMTGRDGNKLYNDGMDIGLCRLDLDSGRLTFAGAQLSLFLVRNGNISRIKGDIRPLGDDHMDRSTGYGERTLDLEPGDAIFLFSDGIIHQFGGTDGAKKFSLRKLSQLLIDPSVKDLRVLKERTEQAFNEWKGEHPQTDDVLMIGMRYAA